MANLYRMSMGGGGGSEGFIKTELTLNLTDPSIVGMHYAIFLTDSDEEKQVIPETGTKVFTGTDTVELTSLGNYVIKFGTTSLDYRTEYSLTEIVATDSVDIKLADFFNEWLTEGRITTQYATLEDLLTEGTQNEKDVRQLMTIHASCDKLVEWYNDNPSDFPLSTFTGSRIAMKWIGLRDYICDKLMAIAEVKSALLDGEYWNYILKDKVPVMTSDTAPEGNVIDVGHYQAYYPWLAFNGTEGSHGTTSYFAVRGNGTLVYKFSTPIKVNRFRTGIIQYLDNGTSKVELYGSNDNSVYTPLGEYDVTSGDQTTPIYDEFVINNDDYFLFYKAVFIATTTYTGVSELQFYGRSLNVSTPKSVNNVIQYGEIVVDHETGGTNYRKEKAFDGSTSTMWYTYGASAESGRTMNDALKFIGYKFPQKIKNVVAYFTFSTPSDSREYNNPKFSLEYSDNGVDWYEAISEDIINKKSLSVLYSLKAPSNIEAKYWRISTLTGNGIGYPTNSPGYYMAIPTLSIHGVDCTEREFDVNNGIDYIYDNGVEIIPVSTGIATTKEADYTYTNAVSSGTAGSYGTYTTDKLDINHKTLRAVLGDRIRGNSANSNIVSGIAVNENIPPTIGGLTSYLNVVTPLDATNIGVNIENVKGNYDVSFVYIHNGTGTMSTEFELKEMWLQK